MVFLFYGPYFMGLPVLVISISIRGISISTGICVIRDGVMGGQDFISRILMFQKLIGRTRIISRWIRTIISSEIFVSLREPNSFFYSFRLLDSDYVMIFPLRNDFQLCNEFSIT